VSTLRPLDLLLYIEFEFGNLIPPGIAFIVHGMMTNTSIGKLYAAGMVPGILRSLTFMATIVVIALARPHLVATELGNVTWGERIRGLPGLAAPSIVFAVIMGSIYTGWATVTESAALAMAVAFPFAWINPRRSFRTPFPHHCGALVHAVESPRQLRNVLGAGATDRPGG